jgi:hypothetical protein
MTGTARLSSLLVSSLLVVATAAGGTPAANADPGLPGASTADVHADPSAEMAHLTAVRLAGHDGFDRMVLEFADRVPGYTVGYRPLPAREDASGLEIPLPGAGAVLQISIIPATAAGWGGGPQTYSGPGDLSANTGSVTEFKSAGDFEAVLTWVAGVRMQQPFRVLVLDGPPRLVVDVAS